MNQENTGGGNYKWWVLVIVALANFSAALDMSIIVVSFPRLADVFNTDASVVIWLAIAFSIAELGLLLTLAKVGDTVGRKKVFVIGIALYTLGLIFCSISPNMSLLIASRVVQGAGAAVIMTVGSAIVVAAFPRNQQGRAIGLFSMFTSVGLIAGPALGGVIIDYLDWQGIFYTRIPIGVLCLLMSLIILKEQKEAGLKLKLDYGGALTLLIGMACLLLYLNLGSDMGYTSAGAIGLLAAAVIFLVAFFFIERRVAQPVLDMGFFKNRNFTTANLTAVLQMTGGSIGPVLFPFLMMGSLLYSPSKSGLLMALIAIPPVIISPITGWLSDKIGNRIPMIIATSFSAAALLLGSLLDIETQTMHIVLILLLFGVGMGMFMAPSQSAIIGGAPRRNLATTLGVANTMRLLGASTGMAVAGTLFAYQQTLKTAEYTAQGIAAEMAERLAIIDAYQYVILLAAGLAVLSIIAAAFVGKRQPETRI